MNVSHLTDLVVDIDDKSLEFARQNVQSNGLQNRIKLLQSKPDGPLIPLDILGFERYTFISSNKFCTESSLA